MIKVGCLHPLSPDIESFIESIEIGICILDDPSLVERFQGKLGAIVQKSNGIPYCFTEYFRLLPEGIHQLF